MPGKIVPLSEQNAIIIRANPETFNEILARIQELDIPQKQIEIRARVIEVSLSNAKQFGIDWSKLNHLTTILAEDPVNQTGTGLPYNYNTSFLDGTLPHGDPLSFEVLPKEQYFQKMTGWDDVGHFSRQLTAFDITMDWLLENNAAKLLTDTRITAMNGEDADILIGEVVPFVVTNNVNQVQVERQDVGIKLKVKATVNKDGQITTTINPEVSSVLELVGGYVPRTKIRRVHSTVTVPDGKKIIVGGLLNSNLSQKTSKLPLLGDIPFIGKLFQHRYEVLDNTDLIIEITPRIVDLTDHQKEVDVDPRLNKHLIQYKD
jgi:type II secretory pathway component GspD/PulD (secretin)